MTHGGEEALRWSPGKRTTISHFPFLSPEGGFKILNPKISLRSSLLRLASSGRSLPLPTNHITSALALALLASLPTLIATPAFVPAFAKRPFPHTTVNKPHYGYPFRIFKISGSLIFALSDTRAHARYIGMYCPRLKIFH